MLKNLLQYLKCFRGYILLRRDGAFQLNNVDSSACDLFAGREIYGKEKGVSRFGKIRRISAVTE